MFRRACSPILKALSEWRRRHRTRDDYPDGSSLSEIHRYGIRYTSNSGNYVDIGYEAATEGDTVWLIHEGSLDAWDFPSGMKISEQDKREILRKLLNYCCARRRPSRVVP
jgi:hypothetical protein